MTLATDQNSDGLGLSGTALQFSLMRDAVMDHWEGAVRTHVEGARNLAGPILTNALPAFFDNIVEAISPVHPREHGAGGTNASSAHGSERARMTPFGPEQVIHEYQIFRESIATVAKGRVSLSENDWAIIDRSVNAAMREAIQAFTKIQEEFRRKVAAALSHDMRTPLAVIGYGAQLVTLTSDLEVARKAAAQITSGSARLKEMMGDLLDALTFHGSAKIPLHLAQFDMLTLVGETLDEYRKGRHRNIEFETAGESVVGHWCPSSMRRAIDNLVNNAIKYGDHGLIRIMVQETRGRMMLTVHNEGCPIPEEQHNRIFEYLRRDTSLPSVEGWGIGLPFVKAVAEAHGGSVAVDSSSGTGTTFLIDVPVDCRPYIGVATEYALRTIHPVGSAQESANKPMNSGGGAGLAC